MDDLQPFVCFLNRPKFVVFRCNKSQLHTVSSFKGIDNSYIHYNYQTFIIILFLSLIIHNLGGHTQKTK